MSEKKQKYAYWMRPSMVAEIEEMLPAANATSKGDFVCKAVEFYIGYFRQQKNINYLAPMLAGAVKSEVAARIKRAQRKKSQKKEREINIERKGEKR